MKYTNLKVNNNNLDSLKLLILVLGYFKKFPVFIVNITFTVFKIVKYIFYERNGSWSLNLFTLLLLFLFSLNLIIYYLQSFGIQSPKFIRLVVRKANFKPS